MTRLERYGRTLLFCLAFGLMAAGPAQADGLTLERVMLSSGGVGYFEYGATVTGDASLTLDVPLDQVDDVLKSLVVYDSGGTAGEITLPGREPLTHGFADLPFNRSDFDSAVTLLNALQGAAVRVASGKQTIAGLLVHVEADSARGADGLAGTQDRVTILTDAGLQQVVLQDVGGIAFVDPALHRQLASALARIARYRRGGERQLTLTLHGKDTRQIRVGYVVAAPLWKASYRLTLPADAKSDKAALQGWAVLENFSGRPWQGVELTLLSGNPVTFRQALYESYFVKRPTVPVAVVGHVLPPPDTGAIPLRFEAMKSPAPPGRTLPGAAMAAGAPPAPAPIQAATASESATQIAFTLPYKVDVPAGQSLVVPIIDRALPARRVDFYQPATAERHPLAAIELTNAGDSGLPPGILTLYQATADQGARYIGDALLATFPRGEKRLLSYAVDSSVTVDSNTATRRYIVRATVSQGVMHVTRLIRQTTEYEVASAPGNPPPALIIEHPRHSDWTLSSPDPKTVEETASAYRIPLTLDQKGAGTLAVTEDQPLEESIAIADLSDDRLGVFAGSGDLDPAVRKALGEVALRRQAVSQRTAALAGLKQQRGRLADDEKRLRANIAALPKDSALRRRLIDRLGEAEKEIEKLSGTIDRNTAALAAAQQELQNFVSGLSL